MPQLKNPRQERLAQGLAAGMTWQEAYVAAGYKGQRHDSHQHVTADMSVIRARRDEILRDRERKLTELALYTKEEVINGLRFVAEKAAEMRPAHNNKGELTGNFHWEPLAAIRAWELLGLELGMFPRVQKDLGPKIDPIAGMNKAELVAYINKGFEKLGIEVDVEMLTEAVTVPMLEARLDGKNLADDPDPRTDGDSMERDRRAS